MSTTSTVERDERTMAVENVSYKWACIFIMYALLLDVMYRGMVRQEAAWDLLALVIVGGAISGAYQARQKTLAQGWIWIAILIASVGGVIGAIVIAIMVWYHR